MTEMRKIITILLLTFTTVLNAQNFEGTLTYSVDIKVSQKMLDMGMTKEILKSKMESDGTWVGTIKTSYKNGFYKQLNLSTDNTWVIYRPDSNKLYVFQDGEASNLCTVNDASIDLEHKMTGKMPIITLLDTIVLFNEYELKTVEVKWGLGTYYYLFSEKHFKTNSEQFKGHIYDGYYEFLKISNSLPIMIIKEVGGMMTITTSLVESNKDKLSDSLFQIPELEVDEELNLLNFGAGIIMTIKN